ncbi:uncharacterized protein LOC131941811 [Physella acuta]|uniref:uncharacterized protein LOC131941811 n=1 Tax=Physella acuta TaxID=109671 RepID=UPI0027DD5A01|nr:uncharacterized protein LOC131941811 [Physella acuta]XP_059157334.1 uncharacterized protein LOC131941811 [Physella acuta]
MGLLDVVDLNFIILVRLAAYSVLVFFSFFIFVGVAVMKDNVGGFCPLYHPGPVSNCNYAMAIAIIFQLFYTLYQIVVLLLLKFGKFTTEMFLFSNVMELVYFCIDVVAFILTFIAACILSAGHNDTCGGRYSCEKFESASRAAQAGGWISTILWLVLCILVLLYMLRSGKIPFITVRATTTTTTTTSQSGGAFPAETSPNNPEEPRY